MEQAEANRLFRDAWKARRIGFTGTRRPGAKTASMVVGTLEALEQVPHIYVGEAPRDEGGVDHTVRLWFAHEEDTEDHIYRAGGRLPYQLIGRSVTMLKELIVQSVIDRAELCAPVLFGFPDKVCPETVQPCVSSHHAWNGSGSGTWATLALAAGWNARLAVFLPPGLAEPPPIWGLFKASGTGWWYRPAFAFTFHSVSHQWVWEAAVQAQSNPGWLRASGFETEAAAIADAAQSGYTMTGAERGT